MFFASFHQNSVGVKTDANYGVGSASVSIDVDTLDETVNENTVIGESMRRFTIGSREVPYPIHTKQVPIIEALADIFWDNSERNMIHQKKVHLDKALTDYATNKGAVVRDGRHTKKCTTFMPVLCIISPCDIYTLIQCLHGYIPRV